ncbi:oxidoreductase [Amycolatopsis orientalis]|uniref:oxidoreductase n=1 Tax=Amycolatopsis orientalis TaxID=31958 RepID=UPI00039EEAC2|nr:FAD-dependent oxidoreductase [Amycolatopsis orientalis]
MEFPHLFAPARIGSLELRNRVVKSPQTTATANPDGTVTERTVNHYRALGEGGAGLVMVEYTYVDDDASKSIHGQTGISRRDHVAGLGWLADEVKSTGARIGLQLVHCGRQKFLGTTPLKSASTSSWDYVERQYGNRPQAMTAEEIHGVVRAFGDAAERAWRARFDLVEIHAGHGYLLTNFLSPHTNDREDEYGGSAENRRRIVLEVAEEVRRRLPREFPLSFRVSVSDYEPDGITGEETVALCAELEKRGVDVIHASGGHHARMEWEVSSWDMPRQPHRWGWEAIRAEVGIPVIASGSLVSPELAEEILAAGSADLVSLGRAMLADPAWAEKARTGRVLEIVPCIRCNDGCLFRGLDAGRSTGCTVNPNMGEEGRYPVVAAATSRRFAVVGGGPAGLKAAAVLHDRGHEVTLHESNRLGGLLNHAEGARVKQDIAGLLRHLVHEVDRRGIKVVYETATAESLAGQGYAGVVVATGAADRPFAGDIADGANVVRAQDALAAAAAGCRVVIVGGGFQGVETALRLSEADGAEITVLERGDRLLTGDEVVYDVLHLPSRLAEEGLSVRLAAEVTEIRNGSVLLAGREQVAADVVVLALGRQQRDAGLPEALASAGIEVSVVGSAERPGRILDALHSSFFAARRL